MAEPAAEQPVRPDFEWVRRLEELFETTPVAHCLEDALATLAGCSAPPGGTALNLGALIYVVARQRQLWLAEGMLERVGLPLSFMDFALAIYVYTLERPQVYKLVNWSMIDPSRRGAGHDGEEEVSADLRACAAYIKFLDTALTQLPDRFIFRGRVQRGVKWVFPTPARHSPETYFRAGAMLVWYEFKSTSLNREVMNHPQFCGHDPGPRTIFTIDAVRGYRITDFSFYGEEEGEVLFRHMTALRVDSVVRNIVDPFERGSIERSGFPDQVVGMRRPAATPPPD